MRGKAAAIGSAQRFAFVDATRGFAIVAALLAHAIDQFFAVYIPYLRPVTRIATPTFLVVFGVVIAVVYMRKARDLDDLTGMRTRLFARMITCYVAFAAISWAGYVGDKTPLDQVLDAMLMLDRGRYSFILFLYTILLALLGLFLPLIVRWGALFFVGFAVLAWALRFGLSALGAGGHPTAQMMFGHATGYGPAVMLSLSVVAVGVLIGEALLNRSRWIWLGGIYLAMAAILAATLAMDGPWLFFEGVTKSYRFGNHPAYFAYGVAGAMTALALFWWLERRDVAPGTRRVLIDLGKRTLFLYTAGNIVLNLLPLHQPATAVSIAEVAVFMLVMFGIALDLERTDSRIDRAANGLFSAFQRQWDRSTLALARVVTAPRGR
ncbi:hypothetical protein [Actibacterium ureilyticum]|uniref:hypothetical protein n=1 Tax=Actibacterium ureilyticum TaxID=1590614 RepID=UPI000BAAE452|nr:hypothetical protein [Actibacterium ureilyticum]